LTNSRSLTLKKAQRVHREIATNLTIAGRISGRPLIIVSRSDSTLRGHYPGEVDALRDTLVAIGNPPYDGLCIIPAFFEGGRFTIEDVHWVQEGPELIPAAQTPYARDATFGYHHSRLPAWVEEKTEGAIKSGDVFSISIEVLREGGPEAVTQFLTGVDEGRVVIVNAASYQDLEVFVAGWQQAEAAGRRFLFRTAASFVRAAAGMEGRDLLTARELGEGRKPVGGLTVFGSHVPKSTAQLAATKELEGMGQIELRARALLSQQSREGEIARAAESVEGFLKEGLDATLFTSREVIMGRDKDENIQVSQAISSGLIEVVRRLRTEPRYVIGKGGITSSDLATEALGVKAARVLGQAHPGVPVWRLGPDSRWPGTPFVVFPGNVGDDRAVADVIQRCRPHR
jgi:uncharacterized protein YgbK (DUF1537 family)